MISLYCYAVLAAIVRDESVCLLLNDLQRAQQKQNPEAETQEDRGPREHMGNQRGCFAGHAEDVESFGYIGPGEKPAHEKYGSHARQDTQLLIQKRSEERRQAKDCEATGEYRCGVSETVIPRY